MARVGIAVVTYRRARHALAVVEAVQALTTADYELVIADDGSEDGTVQRGRDLGITVITGANRGVCWNKNRGLYALAVRDCDPLLLLEDDIRPELAGWEAEWIDAARRWDHVAFAHDKIAGDQLSGAGTAEDPAVNLKATAQCTAVSARALDAVGFLDTRFKGYGVGHAEWTTRMKRAGFGFKEVELPDGVKAKANLYIRGGLVVDDVPSHRDNQQVRANQALFDRIRGEPVYRFPWSDGEEERSFLAEQADAERVSPRADGAA